METSDSELMAMERVRDALTYRGLSRVQTRSVLEWSVRRFLSPDAEIGNYSHDTAVDDDELTAEKIRLALTATDDD